jgi:Tfp pilus assembly protein PilF
LRFGKHIAIGAGLLAGAAFLVRGALEPWVQHTPAGAALTALFRSVPMPGGAVPILRAPAEARPALTSLISRAPRDAALYRLRAQEAEVALDFAAAEADWKTYVRNAADAYGAQIELADFYHRRAEPREEIAALTAAAATKDDPLQPVTAQPAWHVFERMAFVAEQEDLAAPTVEPVYRAWVNRYPKERAAWRKLIEYLTGRGQFAEAETEIARYGRAFGDTLLPVQMRADLEVRRGAPDAALAVYDRAFQPLWPESMTASYFKLLEEQEQLRDFVARARTALASNPADLNATARLFHYFRSQNNLPAARRALLEYRIAKESGRRPWTANELETVARLFERLPDVNEAARLYYALYSASPAGGAHTERALYGSANLLLTAPEQPIQFGSADLSFYKDIATIDPSPGFLNGILSLVLNSSAPRLEYRSQNEKSLAYFHRAAASQLVDLLEQRFPRSRYRAPLRAKLIAAYGAYGDDAAVVRAGREYLAAFPAGADRVPVALEVSDALARGNRTSEEFALYDQLLREQAAGASNVPIGSGTAIAVQPADSRPPGTDESLPAPFNPPVRPTVPRIGVPFGRAQEDTAAAGARSADYVRVLDKYLSRLAALNRPLDALRVYRTEIDRNPDDPGLYQRLAGFLEQNGMAREVEDIYTQAIAKFSDRSWYHKLARWYLRRRESSALERISRNAIAVFSGTELEAYFRDIVTQTHPDAALYRQLNLYAHDRFPDDLVFVHNLLDAYSRPESYDAAAADRLLRQYWFYDTQLRSLFFERLSQEGRLYPELAAIRAADPDIVNGQFDRALAANPAAVQFAAEAETWLSHFEAAAPAARALASAYPGRREFAETASDLYRSLAAYFKQDTEIAVTLAGYEQRADPRDAGILARTGDILADRELFRRARVYWDRMAAAQPGKPQGYLDTATVYWDYYRYNDALRWIAAARKKFDQPALFAYQAGAIYEGKRDYPNAVREYLAGALDGQSPADNRLLQLSTRAQTRDLVDRATAAAVASDPSREAVFLRVSVLEAQQRRPDIESLLRAEVDAARTSAGMTELQETARRLGFDAIEEHAAERLAAITNDPVDKMRLTLAYARLLESKKDIAGAARVVDTLHTDHPLILGVVRGAVDFHLRNRQPDQAIDILLDASKQARVDLAAQFTLEAARVATGAGQFDRARTLLTGLLAADPLRAEYLGAIADTYLQAKDDRGFRDYQLAAIQRLRQSSLAPAERVGRAAAIRRSLIPALDRLKDSADAVDQYIEVINSYPDDEALTKEAATYAVAHGQSARLVAYYRKTISAAPLDYRWPIVLGRVETATEDYAAAITDYARAMQDRPDRADVLEAKAHLEERLMRFTDALQSYSGLYDLTYRDPQWMVKVAELRARTGQTGEAVAALRTAIIGARTETADADFQIAGQLESWHDLTDAVTFADRGASLAGASLFNVSGNAAIYARIMARARRMDAVLPQLGSHSGIDQQVARAAGEIIAETYTPEEKARLEQLLDTQAARVDATTRDAVLLPLVESAGLVSLESRWRFDAMTAQAPRVDPAFVALQSQRGVFGELGRQLEDYAARNPGQTVEGNALTQAAQAFINEGDVEGEKRVLGKALARNALSGILLDRYLTLLASRRPDELLAVIRSNGSDNIRNRAVQFAIASDRPDRAYSAVQARGSVLPPVWAKAYTALAGHYFDDHSPAIDTAFQSALDTRTIGARLQAPPKSDSLIVGTEWFYYGSRYGEYLTDGKNGAADAWLPASLEALPGDAGAYLALGDFYAQAGEGAKAIARYEHALKLGPDRGDAHDHIARVLWSENRRPEALARWRSALVTFLQIQGRGVRVPESFWSRAAETFTDIGDRHALGDLRGDIASLLSDYYQRNGFYRLTELVEPAARASIVSGVGTAWLVDMVRSIDNPEVVLNELMRTPGLTDAQRVTLQRELVAVLARRAQSVFGDDRTYVVSEETSARLQLISMLLNSGDTNGAAAEWRQLPVETGPIYRGRNNRLRVELEIRLASKTGGLDAVLERYRSQPETAPAAESLRDAALAVRRDGNENDERRILESVYDREIRNGHFEAPNFLGLAEVNLERNDTAAAVALLNRMVLVVDNGFDTLLPAAELLGKYGRTADAAGFIRKRVQGVPWDSEAKVQLARTLPPASAERTRLLAEAVTDSQAEYKLRAEAARLAAQQPVAAVAGTELALLSSNTIAPDASARANQVEARIDAARGAADPQVQLRFWREALALVPTDGRVRLGALRASLALRRDNLSLALAQAGVQAPPEFTGEFDDNTPIGRSLPYRRQGRLSVLNDSQLTDPERATLNEALAAAAERLDDLNAAQNYLRAAIDLRPAGQRPPFARQLNALVAEQERRSKNAARQPVIRNNLEQAQVVRRRIARSAQ